MVKSGSLFNVKVVIGIIIILFGVSTLMDNLGFDININIWKIWPVLLMVAGLAHLTRTGTKQIFSGSVLLALGILFLLNNYGYLHFGIGDLWPFLLILAGIAILKQGFWGSSKDKVDNSVINISAVLGGGEFKFTSKSLVEGSVTAFMGGCTIDLREAEISGDTLVLDTFAIWGGIEIRVPGHWEVSMEGAPLLGGMSSKTVHTGQNGALSNFNRGNKKFIVKGTAIMGGVEVTN